MAGGLRPPSVLDFAACVALLFGFLNAVGDLSSKPKGPVIKRLTATFRSDEITAPTFLFAPVNQGARISSQKHVNRPCSTGTRLATTTLCSPMTICNPLDAGARTSC
jgi:hypothetical protein